MPNFLESYRKKCYNEKNILKSERLKSKDKNGKYFTNNYRK